MIFPIRCERCGHIHSFIFECWDIHRACDGNIAFACDHCQYTSIFPDTENISVRKFMIDNGSTIKKYDKYFNELIETIKGN